MARSAAARMQRSAASSRAAPSVSIEGSHDDTNGPQHQGYGTIQRRAFRQRNFNPRLYGKLPAWPMLLRGEIAARAGVSARTSSDQGRADGSGVP